MKITKSCVLLFLVIFFIGSNAYSQSLPLSVKVKAGVNVSNTNLKDYDTDNKWGYQIGADVKLDLPFTGLFVQSGLAFTTKGYKYDQPAREITCNANYLQLPILLGYGFNVVNILKINAHVGPYFATGIGGKTKEKIYAQDSGNEIYNDKYNTFSKDGFKKFDTGLIGMLSADIAKFSVSVGYEMGLKNFSQTDVKTKNRNAFATVGYRIF